MKKDPLPRIEKHMIDSEIVTASELKALGTPSLRKLLKRLNLPMPALIRNYQCG